MCALTPVLTARTISSRCSTERKTASARCWYGSAVRPNQASLVMFTNAFGPSLATRRANDGRMSS